MENVFRSLRWPRLFAAVAAAGLVLGVAAASSPLFLSSAANAMLSSEVDLVGDVDAGLTARVFGLVDQDLYETFDDRLNDGVESIDRLDEPTPTAIGAALAVRKPASASDARMRLLYRDGALDKVTIEAGSRSNPGVWMPHTVARALEVDVGDHIELEYGERTTRTSVAGIYRALASVPITAYWRPLTFEIVNLRDFDLSPPPFLIAGKDTFFELGEGMGDQAEMLWHFQLRSRAITYEDAIDLEQRYSALHLAGDDPLTPLGSAFRELRAFSFQPLSVDSLMLSLVDRIRTTRTSLDASVRVLGYAGQAVALFAIGGAGVFIARSRRTELRLMLAQGVSPSGIGALVGIEMLLPTVVGVTVGWFSAIGVVRWLGPGGATTGSAYRDAAVAAGVGAVIAIVVLAAVIAARARTELEIGFPRVRKLLARTPLEVVALILAAIGYYELSSGRATVVAAPGDAPGIDLFVLAFPLLFISGFAGLAARGLKHVLPRLRDRGASSSIPMYLTWRRLAESSATAVMLIALSTVAIGVLIYAATLVRSIDDTVTAKAYVATGSDVAVTVTGESKIPDAPFPITRVTRTRGEILAGSTTVDVLGIDPETFESAAFWDPGFSTTSLKDLLDRLSSEDERLPAVVVGLEIGDEATLSAADFDTPIRIVDRPLAFPGMRVNTPIVVVDGARFEEAAEAAGSGGLANVVAADELWGRGDPGSILEYFQDEGLVIGTVRDAREFSVAGSLRSVTWTFGLMQALGALASLIVLIALVFYLESRQREREISYGLACRMGLRASQHRLALAAELVGMLAIALVVGTFAAVLGAKLVLGHADPLASMPPPVLFRLPLATLVALVPAAILVAVLAAWRVQRAADRVRMGEVMRVAA